MGDKSACMGCGAHPADYCYRCFDKMVDQCDKNAAALNRVGRERDEARAECERLRKFALAVLESDGDWLSDEREEFVEYAETLGLVTINRHEAEDDAATDCEICGAFGFDWHYKLSPELKGSK